MNSPRTRFYLDKQNAKWSGVCAGIADYTGVDVTVIRIGFVLGFFLGSGMLLLAYFLIAGWRQKPVRFLSR
jgi:phage shock protein C